MKRKGKLPVLVVSLTVLAGAWLLAESTTGRLTAKQEESTQPETIALSAGTAEDIRGLSWSRNGESVSLYRDADTAVWVYADDPACPIDASAVEPLVAAAADVTGLMSITGVKDFAQYGLDTPVFTLTVETADHVVTYEVGSETLTGEYYLRVDGTDTVYTEDGSLQAALRIGLDDIMALETAPDEITSVNSLSVTSVGENYEILRQMEDTDLWYGGTYEWHVVRDGETAPLAAESGEALCESVSEIAFLKCVDWHEESFLAYGLDEPQAEVKLSYTTEEGGHKTFTLCFGDYMEDRVYVNIAGSAKVYLVSGTVLDGLMHPDWEAMTPLTVCPVDMDSVTALTVALGGHTYEVDIYTETTQEVDTDGNIEQLKTDYYVANGWTLDSDAAASWLAELTGFAAESLAGDAQGREELLSVTFHLDSELWPEVTLTLWSYDSAQCLCVVNGDDAYFITRPRGESLVTAAEGLLILE